MYLQHRNDRREKELNEVSNKSLKGLFRWSKQAFRSLNLIMFRLIYRQFRQLSRKSIFKDISIATIGTNHFHAGTDAFRTEYGSFSNSLDIRNECHRQKLLAKAIELSLYSGRQDIATK